MFNRSAAIAAAVIALAETAAAAGPDGTFCGSIEASGGLTDVVTEFRSSTDGGLTGNYTFMYQDKPEPGSLVTRDRASSPVITFIWKDRFGNGGLRLSFDPDFGGFSGKWGMASETPTFTWTGKRCAPGSQPGVPL